MRSSQPLPLTIIAAGTALSFIWFAAPTTVAPAPSRFGWSEARNLSHSEDPSQAPVIAAFANTTHVVWVETVYRWPEIYHTYKTGVTDWSTPTRIEAGTQPDLAVGPDGTMDLVWLDESELGGGFRASFIRYRRWDDALRMWLDAADVAVGRLGTLHSPVVAVGPDGVSHVVWVDSAGNLPRLRYRRRSESGWGLPENVSFGTTPGISVDSDGAVHIAWAGPSLLDESHDVYYRWRDPQNGWSLTHVLSNRPAADSVDPIISIDQDDTVHVGWREVAGNTAAILYRSGRKSSWPAETEHAVPSMSRAEAPALAVDERRFVYLAFAAPDGVQLFMREPTRGTWQAGEPIAANEPAASLPDLAAVGEDMVHAVWMAPGVAGRPDVFYRAMGTDQGSMQTAVFTPTTIATTTPTITLSPTATSTATSTPTYTPVPIRTPLVTRTPTAVWTSAATQPANPTLSPTGTWTPSPTSTSGAQYKNCLPLIMRSRAHPQVHRSIRSRMQAREGVHAMSQGLYELVGRDGISPYERFLPLWLYWSRM